MEFNIEKLSEDELRIELEVRNLVVKANQEVSQTLKQVLIRRLEVEREDPFLTPFKAHAAAQKQPQREIEACIKKLLLLCQGMVENLRNNTAVADWLPEGMAKLVHIQGRTNRVSKTQESFKMFESLDEAVTESGRIIGLKQAQEELEDLVIKTPEQEAKACLRELEEVQNLSPNSALTYSASSAYYKNERAQRQHLRLMQKLHKKQCLPNKPVGDSPTVAHSTGSYSLVQITSKIPLPGFTLVTNDDQVAQNINSTKPSSQTSQVTFQSTLNSNGVCSAAAITSSSSSSICLLKEDENPAGGVVDQVGEQKLVHRVPETLSSQNSEFVALQSISRLKIANDTELNHSDTPQEMVTSGKEIGVDDRFDVNALSLSGTSSRLILSSRSRASESNLRGMSIKLYNKNKIRASQNKKSSTRRKKKRCKTYKALPYGYSKRQLRIRQTLRRFIVQCMDTKTIRGRTQSANREFLNYLKHTHGNKVYDNRKFLMKIFHRNWKRRRRKRGRIHHPLSH